MELLITTAVMVSAIGLILSAIALMQSRRKPGQAKSVSEQLAPLLRTETEHIRTFTEEHARGLRQELGETIRGFQSKLDQDIARMGEEAGRNREALRTTIESKLDSAVVNQLTTSKNLREEIIGNFNALSGSVQAILNQSGLQQKERLENVTTAVASLIEKQEKAQESLRLAVETRLDLLRTENATKLDEMRKTVDERLQSTLETRLGESFARVVEHLERVHKGIGEMQALAAGVGDLKRVLTNIRARGTFGEVQLETLLEQFLSPEQYSKNVQTKDHTQERVEFAIRLPGRDGVEALIPVDAKFPHDDYERLVAASENGDGELVAEASKALENRVRACAKLIKEKYLNPPRTTEFAILFLPTEGLYAEALRRPGLFESVQREHHVIMTGPTTFSAILNALQMGFRSLALEKRSSEVWQILAAVHTEFEKYNGVVERLGKQLNTAMNSVNALGVRTRAMNKTLFDVEKLPDDGAASLLGSEFRRAELDDKEELPAGPLADSGVG